MTTASSMRDHLRVMLPRIAPELLSPTAAGRITQWSAAFPPVAGMVECHLGIDEPRSDFLVRFLRRSNELAALTGTDGSRPPIDTAADDVTWARLREFSRHWAEQGSPLAAFGQTWLEFDLPSPGTDTALPGPSFFTDLDTDAPCSNDVVAAALAILRDGPAGSALLATVANCVRELPPDARVFSLGVMFSRPTDAVRVCVADLHVDHVPAYLNRIGWTGSSAQLQAICGPLARFTNTVGLALDVDVAVLPRIGVEYHLEAGRNLSDSAPRWRPFLDRLVENGLCVPHKRDPLLACIGFDHERTDPANWPADLRAASDQRGPQVFSVLFRRLNHVKVVFEPDMPTEAKAYVQLTSDWLSFDPATQQASLTTAPDQNRG